jgi:hypothetical protein
MLGFLGVDNKSHLFYNNEIVRKTEQQDVAKKQHKTAQKMVVQKSVNCYNYGIG